MPLAESWQVCVNCA